MRPVVNKEVAEAAGIFVEIVRSLDLSPILIGALASEAAPGRPQGAPSSRATLDADFALHVPSWGAYQSVMQAVKDAGYRCDPRIEHRVYIKGVRIDVVPFGVGVAPDGVNLVWPISGLQMDLTGFEEASEQARQVELAPGIVVKCVSIPAFVILKIAAYLDRQRRGDVKHQGDAEDLLFWFKHYASGGDDKRRFEVMAGDIPASVDYLSAGAVVLGSEVARLASARSRERIKEFIVHAKPEESGFWSAVSRSFLPLEDLERELKEGRDLLEAFEWGFMKNG